MAQLVSPSDLVRGVLAALDAKGPGRRHLADDQ